MNTNDKLVLEDFLNNPHEFTSSLHSNGFIEIKLNDDYDLHIWSDSIPKPNSSIRIHNHNRTFVNTVLVGTLWQTVYKIYPYHMEHTHAVYDAKTLKACNFRTIAIKQRTMEHYNTGDIFAFYSGRYHSAWNEGFTCNLISYINTRISGFEPKIAVPIGTNPTRDPIKGLHSSAIPLIVKAACSKIQASLRR